jgi:hypothetical protein
VPLTDDYPDGVVFICKEGSTGCQPVGTAFALCVQGTNAKSHYLVTANHVVQNERKTWARVRRMGGAKPIDKPIRGWLPHPKSDVAIAPFDIDIPDTDVRPIWDDLFADRSHIELHRGDVVYFIGLLTDVPTMAERSIPMVRSGRLGATYQTDVPMTDGRTRHSEPRAHLVDCYSRGGFSGSPCLAEQPTVFTNADGTSNIGSYLALLGVIIGHFGSTNDNAGVAVVAPVEAIRDLLDEPELVEMRERANEQAKQEREDEIWANAAVLDSASPESEFDRFEDLTDKLLRVPKKELDEKLNESHDG